MSSFPAILGNKKPSEYKDVLVEANRDRLSFPLTTLNSGEEFSINTSITPIDINTGEFFYVFGNTGNDCFLLVRSTNILLRDVSNNSYTFNYNVNDFDGRIKVSSDGVNYSVTISGSISLGSFPIVDSIIFDQVNNRSAGTVHASFSVINFSLNSELFKPDGNGLTYTGSNGTIVTRNTSHADQLDYINSTMVQAIYGSNLDYKDALVSANQDYLLISKSINWVNSADIDIEIDVNVNKGVISETIYSVGAIFGNANTGGFSLTMFNDSTLRYNIGGKNGAGLVGVNISVDISSRVIIKVFNNEVFVNAVKIADITPMQVDIDNTFYTTLGKDSFRALNYQSMDAYSVTIDGEQFKPTGNGLTYKGSNGTVVTRNTSHADQINYVNLTMINKI